MHVDFLEVFEDKAVTVKLPVKLTGNARGVISGGKLRKVTRKLTVNGLPSAMPENIELDITNLRIGQAIKVGEIKQDGLRMLDADNAVVVAIKRSRVSVADTDEDDEEADAPAEKVEEAAAE